MTWPGWGWRAVAAGGSVVAGVATGVVTNVVTTQPTVPWLAGLGVLVVLLIGLQVWLTVADGRPAGRRRGAGSVDVEGSSSAPITTNVSGVRQAPGAPFEAGDVVGPGAVVVDGDVRGEIRTNVVDVEEW